MNSLDSAPHPASIPVLALRRPSNSPKDGLFIFFLAYSVFSGFCFTLFAVWSFTSTGTGSPRKKLRRNFVTLRGGERDNKMHRASEGREKEKKGERESSSSFPLSSSPSRFSLPFPSKPRNNQRHAESLLPLSPFPAHENMCPSFSS